MWCEVEREVSRCFHITLASLKVMTSDVMTDLDREVIIHACKKFWSWIEAVMEATGFFTKEMCILYGYKVFLKVSSKCIHPNYLFYWFECFHMICPNLSSAPCMGEITLIGETSTKFPFLSLSLPVGSLAELLILFSPFFNPHQNDQGRKGPCCFQRLIALKCLKCQKI